MVATVGSNVAAKSFVRNAKGSLDENSIEAESGMIEAVCSIANHFVSAAAGSLQQDAAAGCHIGVHLFDTCAFAVTGRIPESRHSHHACSLADTACQYSPIQLSHASSVPFAPSLARYLDERIRKE